MRYVSPKTRKRSPIRSASLSVGKNKKHARKGTKKRKGTRKRTKKRTRQSGGSGFVGALRTALLPLLFFTAQKKQQKRVIKSKTKKRKIRR